MKSETFNSVWDALEDDPIVARAKERRANLMILIRDRIEKGKWSQPEVAKMLGISQPRVSDLVHGMLAKFSLEMLLGFLERMGDEVHIDIRKGKPARTVEARRVGRRLGGTKVKRARKTVKAGPVSESKTQSRKRA